MLNLSVSAFQNNFRMGHTIHAMAMHVFGLLESCQWVFADPHKQCWTAEEARLEREREKAARIKAEAAKAAAVAQAVADREAAIARLAAVMEQQPAAHSETDSVLRQADVGSQHVPTSVPVLQADDALAEEQPSKRRCVCVYTRQAQKFTRMILCGVIFPGMPSMHWAALQRSMQCLKQCSLQSHKAKDG